MKNTFKTLNTGCQLDTGYGFDSLILDVRNKIESIGKKYKIVCAWGILEVNTDVETAPDNLRPFFVYADCQVKGKLSIGSYSRWCQSSYLKDFHLGCIFETENTCYILCNKKKFDFVELNKNC